MTTLRAYYDLACSPPTYDFASFLLASEMDRQRRGCDDIEMVVRPGPDHGFRKDDLPPRDPRERERMLHNIIFPMAYLLPSVKFIHIDGESRSPIDPAFGWGRPEYGTRWLVAAAREGVYPLWSRMRIPGDYVTITLREADYWPTRNSNLAEWEKVSRVLRGNGYQVIVIRDTAKADEYLDWDCTIIPDLSRLLSVRAAYYAGAKLNLFVSNGPAWMCLFMGAPCAIFKMTALGVPCASDAYLAGCGFKRGERWPNLRPRQHVSWNDDFAEHILDEIEARGLL